MNYNTVSSICNGKQIGKLDFIKIKSIFSAKATVKGMKRQATDLEKTFVCHLYGQQLVSRI